MMLDLVGMRPRWRQDDGEVASVACAVPVTLPWNRLSTKLEASVSLRSAVA